jgi:chromate transporter
MTGTPTDDGPGNAHLRGPALWWQMFRVYALLGMTGFGGNYQARLHREALKRSWQNEDDLAKLLTLATLVPGGNTTNFAVQIGFRTAGVAGLLCAVLGTFLPGLTGVIALASLYDAVADSE